MNKRPKKCLLDMTVVACNHVGECHTLLRLTHRDTLPAMMPGQFVEVRIDETPAVMLRRPISIHHVDTIANELWLLVAAIGQGTRWLSQRSEGDTVNVLLPLGQGFTVQQSGQRPLLVGGGVGVAPLYYLASQLRERGIAPTLLLGARTASALLQREHFEQLGRTLITTEDGSAGQRGFVTQHTALAHEHFTQIYTCGPKPMMVAVARYARETGTPCEASLENMMACGLGACLCCVEKTTEGNLCVCKEGPVFDINRLLWGVKSEE